MDEFGGNEIEEAETEERYDFTPTDASKHYIDAVNETESVYGLPENLLANLIQTESNFNPEAVGPETKYGKAKGITQIISKFHPEVNPEDPYDSIDYAGRKLKEYHEQFGDWDSAIAAWNAGPTNVKKHGLEGIKTISEFKETQDYLKKINAYKSTNYPQTEAETEAEAEAETTTDEFGGIEEVDQFGGTPYKDPRDMKWEKPLPKGQLLIDNYARPVLQGVGSAAGLVIGGGTGAAAGSIVPGPGTVTGASAGGITGGALGYAMGDEIADLMQEWMGYYEPKPVLMNLQEAGENVREGLTYELGGHSLGPAAKLGGKYGGKIPGIKKAGKWLSSLLPKTDKRAELKAGEVLAAFTEKGPIIAKNIEEAQALEELIPGLKFDLGQLTGDVNVVKFMKEGVDDAGDLAVARAEQGVKNLKAINAFINKTKGTRGTEDALKPLRAGQKMFQEAEDIAKYNLEREQSGLKSKTGPMKLGSTIREPIEAGETAAREKASEMFDKVPDQDQFVDDIRDGLVKILKPSYSTEGPKKFPDVLKRALKQIKKGGKPSKAKPKKEMPLDKPLEGEAQTDYAYRLARSGKYTPAQARAKADILIKESDKLNKADKWQEGMDTAQMASNWREAAEAMEGAPQHKGWDKIPKGGVEDIAEEVTDPVMSLKDIQGLRSEILEDLRTAKDKGYPRSYRSRLVQAIKLIDKKLGATDSEGSKQLQKAQKFFRENVIEKYGKGSVGRLLQGEDTIASASVADNFFRSGVKGEQAAAEFMAVAGDNKEAMGAMKDHIGQKIFDLRSDKTGEITKAALGRFLKNHRHAINKLGLGGEYNTLIKARLAADEALAKNKEFSKSAASRAIGADINDVVKEAFSKGSKKESAEQMIKTIKMSMAPFRKIDQKRSIDGLRNAMVDEILTEIPLEGTARELLSSGQMAKNFRKYDAALKVVFKNNPEKLKAMHTIRKAVKAFEYKTGEKAEVGERYAADVIRRIAFLQGHTTVAAVDISRKAVRALRGLSKEKIHKFVNRGILDPDVAWDLIRVAKGGSEKKIAHGMTQSLVRLGLIAPQRKEKERKKR